MIKNRGKRFLTKNLLDTDIGFEVYGANGVLHEKYVDR